MFLKIALAIIVAMALYGVWQKFQIQTLTIENINLTTERDAAVASVDALETRIDFHAAEVQAFQEKIAVIDAERVSAREQVEYMQGIFNGHDFNKLLQAKPGLIEIRMKKATAKVLLELENAANSD